MSEKNPSGINRRDLLKGAGALGATAVLDSTLPHSHDAALAQESLTVESVKIKELADQKGVLIGGITDPTPFAGDLASNNIYAKTDFNTNVTNQHLHFPNLYDQQGNMDLTGLEHNAQYAEAKDMKFEVHHLNRGGFNPVDNLNLPSVIQQRVQNDGGDPVPFLKDNISGIVTHLQESYPADLVSAMVVTNEPLNPTGGPWDFTKHADGSLMRNYWNDASYTFYGGTPEANWQYIVESFKHTAELYGDQQRPALIINEYGVEQHDTSKGAGYLELVNYLHSSGVPIDGVGFQMHLRPGDETYENGNTLTTDDEVIRFAENFAQHIQSFPVKPYITEMDITSSFWQQQGMSSHEISARKGKILHHVLRAFRSGGGDSIMFYNYDSIRSAGGLPNSDPESPQNQIATFLNELPDVGK